MGHRPPALVTNDALRSAACIDLNETLRSVPPQRVQGGHESTDYVCFGSHERTVLARPVHHVSNAARHGATPHLRLHTAQGQTDRLRAAILDHRSSFVTEADFAAMAAGGVNAVRLPVGYWALEMSAVLRLPSHASAARPSE